MTIVKGIPADEITVVWPLVEHLVERALRRTGDHTLESVHQSLRAGQRQLFVTWPGIETICITAIDIRANSKVLLILWKAGRLMPDWRDMLTACENWGRSVGCKACEIQGRKGWERLLPDYKASVLLRKDLTDA